MQRETKRTRGNIRRLTLAAILAAMSIVLGKYLQIPNPFQEIVRVSFENLPVILAGIVMGPVMGATVGVVADLVGCLMVGYTPIPFVTLGAACVGALSGLTARYILRRPLALQVALSVLTAHFFGSCLVKTVGLASWYAANYGMGFLTLFGWRALTYAVVGALEGIVLYILMKNKSLAGLLERMCNLK